MDALIYLVGTTILFVAGFYAGWNKGIENGEKAGYHKGVQDALNEVDTMMRGGLISTLDWESSQQMLREKLWNN